jgi:ATP-dependent Clp protease adapter protein ClpS
VPSFPSEKVFNELAGKTIRQAQSQRRKSLYTIAIQSGSLSFPSSRTVDTGVDSLMNLQRCDVVLPNDDQTPMEFVVFVRAERKPRAHQINQRDHRSRLLICPVRPAIRKVTRARRVSNSAKVGLGPAPAGLFLCSRSARHRAAFVPAGVIRPGEGALRNI